MKKKITYLFAALMLVAMQTQAQRYVTEVFTNVDVSLHNQYATNITVISGAPAPQKLYVDIYTPNGDTETARPLVLIAHTGSFLPIGTNGTTTGDTSDYAVVQIATKLAKRGYVAAIFSYRKGWNPLAASVEERRGQLINAAYKGVQDLRTVTRYFRKNVAEGGNTWGIDPNKIATWGQGTGGYITLASAFLTQDEIYIDKFKNPSTGTPYIDTLLWGNVDGTSMGAATIPNIPGYPSDVKLVFNAGGALGDSSWLDAGEIPVLSAHVVSDPYAPFGYDLTNNVIQCEGPVIVPTTGEFVVNVSGSKCVVNRANGNGNNLDLNNAQYTDPVTVALAGQSLAEPNLWAIHLPGPQAGPWEFWSEAYWSTIPHPSCPAGSFPACNFNTINKITNPDMSQDKADRYIDTLVRFFAPRANDILNDLTNSTQELLNEGLVSAYPNPADNIVWVEMNNSDKLMEQVELFDLQGRLVRTVKTSPAKTIEVQRNNLPPGMYLMKVAFHDGIVTKKLIFR